MPPEFEEGDDPPSFIPAIELTEWAMATFIADGAPLENLDHRHLKSARIGTGVEQLEERASAGHCAFHSLFFHPADPRRTA